MGKRRIRVRDSEATRRKLLDAVSTIMREQGFTGLRTAAITRLIGRDKNLIRYHFSGLAGLQKAYVAEKDYWGPFFERFVVDGDSSSLELEQLFSELMAENLRFFYSDPEMQKIILWQISERNALMRSISDAREADGAKLLGLSDRFFSGTDVNFRAVIALLLGGAYYMVLHANGNGSVVCGIDVHSEKDRSDVLRTIGQVVSWAFARVDDGLGRRLGVDVALAVEEVVPVNEFTVLENLSGRFLRYVHGGRSDVSYSETFSREVVRLEAVLMSRFLGISNLVKKGSFVEVCIFRLGRLADGFYLEIEDVHGEAELLLELMDSFIGGVKELVPGSWVLPRICWEREMFWCTPMVCRLEMVMEVMKIDRLLAKAVKLPFLDFAGRMGEASYGELLALKSFLGSLLAYMEGMEVSNDGLFALMVGLDVSGVALVDYFASRVDAFRSGKSLVEVRSFLRLERERILIIGNEGGKVRALLLDWIDLELVALSERKQVEANPLKFTSELKATELAYLLKLLFDQGVFGKVKLDVFVSQSAHNFSTVFAEQLSSGSIKSKLYPSSIEVIGVVEELLVAMLEQLRRDK